MLTIAMFCWKCDEFCACFLCFRLQCTIFEFFRWLWRHINYQCAPLLSSVLLATFIIKWWWNSKYWFIAAANLNRLMLSFSSPLHLSHDFFQFCSHPLYLDNSSMSKYLQWSSFNRSTSLTHTMVQSLSIQFLIETLSLSTSIIHYEMNL